MNGTFVGLGKCRSEERETAREILKARIVDMETLFREKFAHSDKTDMDDCVYGALMSGGKRLRPMLLFFSSGFGCISDRDAAALMAVIEMIHTASLVHDDIVDNAFTRRGKPTVNAVKGNRFAAQCAYYLIAAALKILKSCDKPGVYEILAGIPMEMCLGELQQLRMEYGGAPRTDAEYFERIERKTARLMQGSCLAGARAAGLSAEHESSLGAYGHALGMLFQLRDDLLDCEETENDGKPVFQDPRRGIYNYPLLCAMRKAPDSECVFLMTKRDKTDGDLLAIMKWLRESGGAERTRELMKEYADRANAALAPLPETGEKAALEELLSALTDNS
ncbi:MAG: polyprenyl synthetase family protein [Clostridiales Family XIII bacterium]|jgi:geranylgeranyl pyrophosphate synthase|nr:polyprenyl synthetase family protein [Clostridiales Family XIII bacterium]